MVAHYAPVWNHLPTASFSVLLSHEALESEVSELGIPTNVQILTLEEALAYRLSWRVGVGNHPLPGLTREQYTTGSLCQRITALLGSHRGRSTPAPRDPNNTFRLDRSDPRVAQLRSFVHVKRKLRHQLWNIKLYLGSIPFFRKSYHRLLLHRRVPQLVDKALRFPYGPDLDEKLGLAHQAQAFDFFFCHGPLEHKLLQDRYERPVFQIGYPKLEKLPSKMTRELSEHPFICWLPTSNSLPGQFLLPRFLEEIGSLTVKYRIVVRPHPATVRDQPEILLDLRNAGFEVNTRDRDSAQLMSEASAIICDFGGSPFGALYLRKPTLLLRDAGSAPKQNMLSTYPIIEDIFPIAFPGQLSKSIELLLNGNFWETRRELLEKARTRLFGDNSSSGGSTAAKILMQIAQGER